MPLPKSLTTVTTLSKTLAMILFITLPFIGFYVGKEYQEKLTPAATPQLTTLPPIRSISPSAKNGEIYIVMLKTPVAGIKNVTQNMKTQYNLTITNVYDSLNGFAAIIPLDKVAAIKSDPRVSTFEKTQTNHVN